MYDDRTIARFWEKVDRRGPDECWVWKASMGNDGYGRFRVNSPYRSVLRPHKFSFLISHGSTNGLFVCHTCDNPPCVNPKHLWLGTPLQNTVDAKVKGRLRHPGSPGETNPMSKLTQVDVDVIRSLLAQGVNNTKIAERFNVTHSMVSLIKLGKAWASSKLPD
jgi:hypothetical protein